MTAKWSMANVNNEHVPQRILIQQLASSGMKTFPDADNSCISIPTDVNYVRCSGGCQVKDISRLVLISYFLISWVPISWFLIPWFPIPWFLGTVDTFDWWRIRISLSLLSWFLSRPRSSFVPATSSVHTLDSKSTLSLELFSAIALCVEEDHEVLVTAPPYYSKPPSHKVTGHAHTSANLCDKYTHAHFRVPPSL